MKTRYYAFILSVLLMLCESCNITDSGNKTALFNAIDHGNLDEIRNIVENVDDNILTDDQGHSFVAYATLRGREDIVSVLLENGFDINAQDADGETALCVAVNMGSLEIVQFLLQNGADPNAQSDNGSVGSPLYYAIPSKNTGIGIMLLSKGASVPRVREELKKRLGNTAVQSDVLTLIDNWGFLGGIIDSELVWGNDSINRNRIVGTWSCDDDVVTFYDNNRLIYSNSISNIGPVNGEWLYHAGVLHFLFEDYFYDNVFIVCALTDTNLVLHDINSLTKKTYKRSKGVTH